MARWLIGIGVLLVVLVGIGFAAFDWNWLRDPAASRAGGLTGRKTSLAGDIHVKLGRITHIELSDVSLANAPWSKDAQMIHVDQIQVTVDVLELLRGRLVLPELRLEKPVIVLEKNAGGIANWQFNGPPAAGLVTPDNRTDIPVIGLLVIRDGQLSFRDPASKVEINATLSTAVGTGGDDRGQRINLQGKGTLAGQPLTIIMSGDSLLALRDPSEPYRLKIDLSAGKTRVVAEGTVTDPVEMKGLDLRLTLQGDNAANLFPIFGVPAPATPPYNVAGRLTRDGKVFNFAGMQGKVGESDLNGIIKVDTGRNRTFVTGNLNSRLLDYRDVGAILGIPPDQLRNAPPPPNAKGEPQAAKPAAPKLATGDERVLPDANLDIAQVRSVDADVQFQADKINAPNAPLDKVTLHVVLDHGVLTLNPLNVGVAGGRLESNIVIDGRADLVKTSYDIRFRDFRLEEFLDKAGLQNGGSGTINGRVKMKTSGNSVRKAMSTAEGDASLIIGQGEISDLGQELLGLHVAESLGLLASGDHKVPLNCFVADFHLENGVAHRRIFVIDSNETTVNVDGDIDFGQEKLDLTLLSHPKHFSPLSGRTPIRITGTFNRPDISLDPKGIGARAGIAVALGILLTPLASIIPFIDPGLQGKVDCLGLAQSPPVR